MYFGGNDDGFNDWSFRGLPDAYTGGALFSNKWNGDKQNVNASYRYNRLGMQNRGATLTQNILSDTVFYTNSYVQQRARNQQHAVNGKWEWKPDSLTTLKFTTALTHRTRDFYDVTNAESLSEERQYVNTSDRTNEGRTERLEADNNLSYKRSFKKTGRLFNASLRFRYIEDDLNGFLRFQNKFYENGVLDSTANADQQKLNDNTSATLGAKLTYAEPLSTKWTAFFTYGYNQNNAQSRRNTFDRSLPANTTIATSCSATILIWMPAATAAC